jgi:hypothetical protein
LKPHRQEDLEPDHGTSPYSQSAFTFVPTKTCSGTRYQDGLVSLWKGDQQTGFCFASFCCVLLLLFVRRALTGKRSRTVRL